MLSLPLDSCVTHLVCALDISKIAHLVSLFIYFTFYLSTYPKQPTLCIHFQNVGVILLQGTCIWGAVAVSTNLYHSCPFLCQIFEGNSNYDTPELRTVEPLLTRFVRIYPERSTPAGMGLRLELLGCEIEGKAQKHVGLSIKSIALSVLCLKRSFLF